MPIYEYACGKCEHEFEVEQRMSDPPVKTCPRCRSRKVKRLISRTSFVLKGSGWYSDLYSSAKKSDKSDGKSDGDAKTASDKGDTGGAKDAAPAKSAGTDKAGSKDSGSKGSGKPQAAA